MLLPRNLACLLFAFSSPLSAYLPAVNPRPAIMSSVPQEFQGYIKLGVRVSSRNGALCVCVCVGLCRSGCFNSLLFAVAAAVPLRPPRVPVRVVSKGAGDDAAAVDITWFCLCGASLTSLSSLISSRLTHLHLA